MMPKSCDTSHIRMIDSETVETYLISYLFLFLLLFYKTSSSKNRIFIFYFLLFILYNIVFFTFVFIVEFKIFIHVFIKKKNCHSFFDPVFVIHFTGNV